MKRTTLLLAIVAFVSTTAVDAEQITEGCLQVVDRDHNPVGFCPLKHTDVDTEISGFIARVTVTQEFANPFDEPIEAVYTFPMSDRAAVDSMTMRIGERVVKGLIKRREEARRIYQAARDAGKAASLLDQERPNIFTQSVANILPGEGIVITISYVEYLKYEDGEYEFSFPMVVGPRYIPAQVPDANRITPPVTPKGTRAGHDIGLTVSLDAGVAVHDIRSELHKVVVERPGDSTAVVRLKNQREIPNRDFVLKYRVGGKGIADAILTHAGVKGNFFTLILQPPERVRPEQVTPKEMMFVIDRSGSMSGFPIEKAKKTMRICIEQMNPNDTFNLVSFAGGVGYCFDKPMPNTRENRAKALEYLANLQGGGGTEMMRAIHAALEGHDDPERLRIVCFMTDGFIGNDMAILDAIQKNAGTARVFGFGIGNSVNRFLIEGMARAGRGAAEIVTLESDGDAAAQRFHERIHSPILTDITVDFGRLPIEDVYPEPTAIPDLFAAQPLMLKGRYTGSGKGAIIVRGNTASGTFERRVRVTLPSDEPGHDVLAPLWARTRIGALMAEDWHGVQQGNPNSAIKEAITKLGLDFGLVTQFTSFVAVEETVITEGGKPKTVHVPVEMPDGVSYEGVFGDRAVARGKGMATPGTRVEEVKSLGYLGAPASGGKVEAETAAVRPMRDDERVSKPAPVPEPPKGKRHPKIDPALWGLEAKLVNGNYAEGPVKVTDGWVEVFIRLTDDSPQRLEELEKLGVKITSHAASGKVVFAKVRVADLETVARLGFISKIEPPSF